MYGLQELPSYVTDPTASAQDDAQTEWVINHMPLQDVLDLAAYGESWDAEAAEGREEDMNRRALVRPALPWHVLLPVAVVSLAILFFVWGA